MVDVQTVGVLVTAASVSVAAIYYAFTLRINMKNQELSLKTQELALKSQQQNQETRQAQLFMGIYQTFYSRDFVDYEAILNKIKFETAEDYTELQKNGGIEYKALSTFGAYYEGMGLLVRENLVDIRLVSQLMSGNIIWYWERFGSAFRESRRVFNWSRMCVEVEYLYNRIIEYSKEHPELQITIPTTH